MLAFALFFVGFGLTGSLSVDGAVFLENIPPNRAYLLTGISVLCSFGSMYTTGFAWIFSILKIKMMWRFLLGYNAFLNALVAIPRFWIEETPSFLISKQRYEEANSILSNLLKYNEEESSNFIKCMETPNIEVISIFEQVVVLDQILRFIRVCLYKL